ncbi:MAG: hypothetical protein GY847_15920 [Proteobacteria bacterium]|nr:hypothetical protein [Pseudomonadota bacterium]
MAKNLGKAWDPIPNRSPLTASENEPTADQQKAWAKASIYHEEPAPEAKPTVCPLIVRQEEEVLPCFL